MEVARDASSTATKVLVGEFETTADGAWWKLALRKRGCPDAFLVTVPNEARKTVAQTTGPLTPNFKPLSGFAARETGAIDSVRARLQGKPKEDLGRILAEEPEANTAGETETQNLVEALRPVADGDMPASLREACRARIAIAHLWHYGGKRRWLTAYHCYGEALSLAVPGSAEEAECLLQRAALLMELAKSGLGTMEECRRGCRLVAERVPEGNLRARAVAALMHAEALFEEERYSEALDEFLALPDRWPTQRREVAAALVYGGIAAQRLKQSDLATYLLQKAVEIDVEGAEFFQWRGKPRDAKRDAARWLAHIYARQGNATEARKWGDFVRTRPAPSGEVAE